MRRLTGFNIFTGILIVCMTLILAFTTLYTVGRYMPFEPLVVNTYYFPLEEACPGDLIDITTDRYVDEDYEVNTIHVESYWTVDDDPRPYIPYSYDLNPSELVATEGSALRLAPFTAGDWKITTEFTIEGTVLGVVDRTQSLTIVTSNSLSVPVNNVECKLAQTQDRT